jgi:hypothetical protein
MNRFNQFAAFGRWSLEGWEALMSSHVSEPMPQRASASAFWGIPPLIGLSGLSLLALAASYYLPFGLKTQGPFSYSFPFQIMPMVLGLLCHPLLIFSWMLYYWFQKRMTQAHTHTFSPKAVLVPVLLISVVLAFVVSALRLWFKTPDTQFPASSLILGGVTLASWSLLWILPAIAGKKAPIGTQFTLFFGYKALLFAKSFIPDFGILDRLVRWLFLPLGEAGAWEWWLALLLRLLVFFWVLGLVYRGMHWRFREMVKPLPAIPEPPLAH